jgi:hypothetical protein
MLGQEKAKDLAVGSEKRALAKFGVVVFVEDICIGNYSPNVEHFVFTGLDVLNVPVIAVPACENGRIDPTRPQTTWRTAWRRLTRAILCPACDELQNPGEACQNEKCKADIRGVKSPTARLRFHDLRHHAITELAESQASDQTVMAIAGHVSPKMLAHYSHVRMDAKRKALDALSLKDSGSYGTNHDTNALPGAVAHPQVIEINGRLVGTRTPDLHRVKVAL